PPPQGPARRRARPPGRSAGRSGRRRRPARDRPCPHAGGRRPCPSRHRPERPGRRRDPHGRSRPQAAVVTGAALADPPRRSSALGVVVLAAILVVLILALPALAPLFHALFPDLPRPMYERASFVELTLDHLALVVAAGVPVIVAGVALGIFVTRPRGRDFAGIVDTLTAIGQTLPPSAVLAIAVPLVGYGAWPTIVALVAYGILPVVDGTVV